MFTKTLLAAALAVPVLALSGVAYADNPGGPKSTISTPAPKAAVKTKKPYAQYVPEMRTGGHNHIYVGGPKSTIPHRMQ